MRSASKYAGLVLTSQRSVDAISNAFAGALASGKPNLSCLLFKSDVKMFSLKQNNTNAHHKFINNPLGNLNSGRKPVSKAH